MPSTCNGLGTTYLGKKDQQSDGSFITTEWFVILFFPILPIRSYRVIPLGKSKEGSKYSQEYLIIKKLPLDWLQIFTVFSESILTVAFSILMGWLGSKLFRTSTSQVLAFIIISSFLYAIIFRYTIKPNV
jgi:hypothetical protein